MIDAPRNIFAHVALAALCLVWAAPACSSSKDGAPAAPPVAVADAGPVEVCVIPAGQTKTDFLEKIGCTADFEALASEPIDATIPGARSTKVGIDQADGDYLWYQNSTTYKIHYEFASRFRSGNKLPVVPALSQFNTTEYYTPDRRFVLGAATYYQGPKLWVVEISPYDTAPAEMITKLYRKVRDSSFFGSQLWFHPTSEAVAAEAKKCPPDVKIKTTDEIYAGIDYQPLTLATGVGRLHFTTAAALANEYLSYQDIVVLDEAPNDITVVQGIISQQFQTPLAHINVLSQNRKTPNMGLRGALTNPILKKFEGKLVELIVSATEWKMREVTQAEAEAFWKAHRPAPVTLPPLDLSVTALAEVELVAPDPVAPATMRDSIKKAVQAYGGKTAHYAVLKRTSGVPVQKAFGIPVFYYDQFMKTNGLYTRLDGYLADATFKTDAKVRDAKLAEMRAAILAAPLDQAFQDALKAKIIPDYAVAGYKVRFRTSTNSEDLDGFPCAGCYDSKSGDWTNWPDVLDSIREVFTSVWKFRTFEERSYYGVDHKSVGMALLVHRNYPNEEANGVAVTANPFDAAGVDPAFYVNVQYGGDIEVVAPPPGTQSDQFLYFFDSPNQPIQFLFRSNQIPAGKTVLSVPQTYELGVALKAIHKRFSAAYGPASGNTGWYAMDVEFKFDDDADKTKAPTLYVKQARPYPGRGK